jgi:hypothetical protein
VAKKTTPNQPPEPTPQPVMAETRKSAKPHVHYHKEGSVWARGQLKGDTMVGYWEWFRKDGTRMRSGYFEDGVQTGEWITYDKKGRVYKVTTMKPKTAMNPLPAKSTA